MPVLDDLGGDHPGRVGGNGKAQALDHVAAAAGAAQDGAVDADDLPGQVDQRAARIAVVDGGVGLDQAFHQVAIAGIQRAPGGADHAHRNGILKIAQRRADGDDGFARFQGVRIAQLGRSRQGAVHLQYGDIGELVAAHQGGRHWRAVGQHDLDA